MKILLSFLFVLLSTMAFGQSVLPLRADTVLIEKSQGNGELKIKNSTRDTLGVMVNMGGGRTRFMRVRVLNDSTFIMPPNDTIVIRGGASSGPGTVPTLNQVTAEGNGSAQALRITDVTLAIEYASLRHNGSKGQLDLENGVGGVTEYHMDSIVRAGNALRFPTGPGTFALREDLADSAAAIRADFPTGTGISGLTLGRVVIPASATTVTDDAGLTYDSTVNELSTDSTSVIQHRADYVTLNAVQVVDTVRAFGNSITEGANASPIADSSYPNRTGVFLEKPVGNYAISGRGSVTAIAQHYLYTPLLHNDMSLVMVGFNDIRRNDVLGANGYKTLNKIVNAHKSIFFNHFLKSFVSSGSGSVTRYGSWATPWDARNEGGKSGTAAYSGTQNDSITYAFTDSTVGIGLIGSDGEGSAYSVYIDNVLTLTGTTVGQYDGINDGFPGNTRAPLCVLISGLTYTSHTVKIVKTGASSILIVDYFGHLRDAATAPPLVILHAPYMNAAGYATAPNGSSVIKTDTMNNKLDSLVASFPSAYQPHVFLIETNNCYDTLTGLDLGDNIHPNNIGHMQIFDCIQVEITTDSKPEGSLYYANDAAYFTNSTGPKKLFWGTGTANYIPKFTDVNVLGNSLIRDDGTNVGINQAPATYKLGVTGTLRVTADAFFATGSGNVGIGNVSPSNKLSVTGSADIAGALITSGASSTIRVGPRNAVGSAFEIYGASGAYNFYMSTAVDFMKFSADGKIGINKTPVWGLDIVRSVGIDKDSLPIITSLAGNYLVTVDTAATADSNRLKRILPANLGFLTNPMTTAGDIIVGGASGVPARLAIGANGTFATSNGTTVVYTTSAAAFPVSFYTPTLTGVLNVTSTAATDTYYQQIGDKVEVWGTVQIDPTTATTLTTVGVSLPVASTFTDTHQLSGSGFSEDIQQGFAIKSDAANSRALISFFAADASGSNYQFKFSYKVTPP